VAGFLRRWCHFGLSGIEKRVRTGRAPVAGEPRRRDPEQRLDGLNAYATEPPMVGLVFEDNSALDF
jgi:hypothetical protein